jgi:hypothetical protein
MNYCSIQDAWGSANNASKQFTEYSNNITKPNIEHFSQNDNVQKTNHFNQTNNCDSFLSHIRNCRKCYNKMNNFFKPKLIEKFQGIVDENRDTIVLFLIGVSILLFFNLINNITKN